ncbi:5751_t:CDS:10 [Funneliformis geosporum]|uniref:19452_t:CDS:1 n=1 Tax=Funneliformis geosporum TaxID=1117311 RepID=A0A9W4WSG3_9GLOM|nr:5751_t:CDS:10 [Funneliformis geosporum]CAI2168814.1 19452_t:CDS:10 [Funneliformis geosporum]
MEGEYILDEIEGKAAESVTTISETIPQLVRSNKVLSPGRLKLTPDPISLMIHQKMEPEAFVNLLLDHVESKAVISTEYNYLHLHTWEVAPEIAARLPSTYKSYQNILLTYICSNNIVPDGDLTFNGNFLAHVLAKRLRESANPKTYTSILKFFNTFEFPKNFCRPSLELLIIQVFDDSEIPGQTIQWLLSFIRDQAGWLYSINYEEVDVDAAEIQRIKNFRAFLSEKFCKISKTLLYEDLELLRMVQGFSKVNDIKVKPDVTNEEILISHRLHACQNILDIVTLHPSEYRILQSDLHKVISRQEITKLRPLHIMYAEFPCQIDLLLNQLRFEQLITFQEIDSLKLKPFLATLMYNNIVNEYLDRLELLELELAQNLKNNQDISDYQYSDVFNLSPKHQTEWNPIYETFLTLKRDEIVLLLLDIAEFAMNVPFRFMMRVILTLSLLHRLCREKYHNFLNDSNLSNKDDFKEINRIILDIWLSSFSRLRISRFSFSHQTNSSVVLKNLQTLTTLFIFTFYASSHLIWFQYCSTSAFPDTEENVFRSTLTLFIENLSKIFKIVLDNDLGEERKSIEALIHIIFDKLGFEIPLEAILKETKHLLEVVEKDVYCDLLEIRIRNAIQEKSK